MNKRITKKHYRNLFLSYAVCLIYDKWPKHEVKITRDLYAYGGISKKCIHHLFNCLHNLLSKEDKIVYYPNGSVLLCYLPQVGKSPVIRDVNRFLGHLEYIDLARLACVLFDLDFKDFHLLKRLKKDHIGIYRKSKTAK